MRGGVIDFAITAFTSIFIIVDPPGNIPVFLSLTVGYDENRRRRAGLSASLTCFATLSLFAIAGPAILSFFHISIDALRIAGGLILFIIGIQMLHVQRTRTKFSPEEEAEWTARDDIGVVPMGLPLLAGPGAITAVVVLTNTAPPMIGPPVVVACVALTAAICYFTLVQSAALQRLLGQVGINVMMRLMGLLLAVIGVQLILDGLAGAFPTLFRGVRP